MIFSSAINVNELKKGTRIQLRNGFFGTIKDNEKESLTRLVQCDTMTHAVACNEFLVAQINGEWKAVTLPEKFKRKIGYER